MPPPPPTSTLFPYTTLFRSDLSKLSPNDRKVLARLVRASQIINGIFLRQAWAGNPSMLLDLAGGEDRKSTRLNSSHRCISYAVFCLKKKKTNIYNADQHIYR